MVLAPRGLREEDDGTRRRMAGEFLVAVQRQARTVWLETVAATMVVTGAVVAWAALR